MTRLTKSEIENWNWVKEHLYEPIPNTKWQHLYTYTKTQINFGYSVRFRHLSVSFHALSRLFSGLNAYTANIPNCLQWYWIVYKQIVWIALNLPPPIRRLFARTDFKICNVIHVSIYSVRLGLVLNNMHTFTRIF